MNIADELRWLLDRYGGQGRLAKDLGTSQQNVSNWLNGVTRPRDVDDVLQRILSLRADVEHQTHGEPERGSLGEPKLVRIHEHRERPFGAGPRAPKIAEDVVLGLPDRIQYQLNSVVRYQGLVAMVDYLSDKVCCGMKALIGRGNGYVLVESGIRTLTTIRKIHERQGAVREIYLLIVIGEEIVNLSGAMNRLLSLASLHDVMVLLATTPSAAAQQLVDLEDGNYDHPQDMI